MKMLKRVGVYNFLILIVHLLVVMKNEKYLVLFEWPEGSTTLGLGMFYLFLQYVTIVFFLFYFFPP